MFTESSNTTMAKKASVVAATTDQTAAALARVELRHAGHVALAGPDRPQADHDDDQEAGQLDAGEDDVRLHALADAAEVDRRDQRHEGEADRA
jgi:hypothetical protein